MLDAALVAGLTLDQFWDATIHEVLVCIRAHGKRLRETRRLLAWVQANLMACWIKNAPSVERLMGAPSLMGMSPEEIRDHYRRKKAAAL